MYLRCDRCALDFLAVHGAWFTPCPGCGAKQQSNTSSAVPPARPIRMATRSSPPWVPSWLRYLSGGVGVGGLIVFNNALHFLGRAWWPVFGLYVLALAGGVIWRLVRKKAMVEIGRGRIASNVQLAPWPGSWIPAERVIGVRSQAEVDQPIRATLFARLRDGARVPVLQDIPLAQAPILARHLEAELAKPVEGTLAEIAITTGEREATVRWSCGPETRVEISAHTLRVQREGAAPLELDTDAVDHPRISELATDADPFPRFELVAISRKGEIVRLLEGEVVREPLELVSREIRRVLRLPILVPSPIAAVKSGELPAREKVAIRG